MDIITGFMQGMYYAGKLPSKAEYRDISRYLRLSGLVSGEQKDIERQVTEAIADIHRIMFPEDEKKQKEGQVNAK